MNQQTQARVFLVDDDEDDRFLVGEAFKYYGPACQVIALSSGTELLGALDKATSIPQLVVLDLNMPLMNGLEVLRQLRQRYSPADLPIVIMTTSDQEEDKMFASALHASDFVTKPSTAKQYGQVVLTLKERWLSD